MTPPAVPSRRGAPSDLGAVARGQESAADSQVAPPELAKSVFGESLPLAVRYARWLAGAGVERGLIGPREAGRLWSRHLLNCVAVAALIPRGCYVLDLGSGAGLPGIVLAIARPDLRITLVEPMQRRITFLDEVRSDLALPGVETRRARADDLATEKLGADVVTARAVAPVDRLAGLAAPLLRAGGLLLAVKGSGVAAEVSSGWEAVRRAGMTADAALLAVFNATGVNGANGDEVSAVSDPELLPGVRIAELSTWQPTGLLCEGEAATVPGFPLDTEPLPTDPLALVLRLRRSR